MSIRIGIDTGKNLFLTKKNMGNDMYKYVPKSLQKFIKIDKMSGENFNILINAIGTAAVAPVFIAYNPLAKTDEKTKKYSAMRQPISAVLAVITQCGLVTPWNKMLDYFTNNGKLGQYYSQEAFQDSKYLFRKFKKANRGKSEKEINELVKNYQAKQYGELYANFLNDGQIKVGKSSLSQEAVLEIIDETCNDIIKKNEKTLQRYRSEKLRCQKARADYLTQYYELAKERLNGLKTSINSKNDQETIKIIKDLAKKAKQDNLSPEWIKILQEDLIPKGSNKDIVAQIEQILAKAEIYNNNKDKLTEFLTNQIADKSKEVNLQIDHFKNIKQMIADKKSMPDILAELKKTVIDAQIGDITKNIELDNAGIAVVDKYIAKISQRIKGTKAISGLLVSLAIMPLTCHALNYLYPRFMEKFFPDLANAKKKGGNK